MYTATYPAHAVAHMLRQRFDGLNAGDEYSVVVKRGEGDGERAPGDRDRTICTFTASDAGTGTCTGRFLELRALAVAQLQDQDGTTVAQATRTGVPNPAGGTFTTPLRARSPARAVAVSPSRPARSAPLPAAADRTARPRRRSLIAMPPAQP